MDILPGYIAADTIGALKGRIATVGMFDGVHLGHRHILRSLVNAGIDRGLTPMAVTFLHHPLRIIAPSRQTLPTVTTTSERLRLLETTGISECLLLDFDSRLMRLSARDFLRMLRDSYGVRAFMTGFNNKFGNDMTLGFDDYVRIAADEDIEMLRATCFEPGHHKTIISSSSIRTLIGAHGNVEEAARMLGRPFTLSGTVIHGKALGRTIGFPTANIATDSLDKLIPLKGVYACQAIMPSHNGDILPAVVNIGDCPTFNDNRSRSIEAHIIGLNHDIYGMPLTLRFLKRVRDERKFSSPQALKEQISIDCDITLDSHHKAHQP